MSESMTEGPSEPKVEHDPDSMEPPEEPENGQEEEEEDLPFLPNIRIVSELNLKNWIIYVRTKNFYLIE